MNVDRRLEGLRVWQRLLDSAFRVPGTGIRFGWDAIIGLVPWVGDAVTALFGSVIIFHAYQLRLPRVVQLRMLINIVIDVVDRHRAVCRRRRGCVLEIQCQEPCAARALRRQRIGRPGRATGCLSRR